MIKTMKSSSPIHRVVMVGFEDAQILDITGPLEVFSRTGRWLVDHGYTNIMPYSVELVAENEGKVCCSSGIGLIATQSYKDIKDIDTLLITGGIGYKKACNNKDLIHWIKTQSQIVTRVGSICTGAFLLEEAGLLSNKKATTHWAYCDKLREAKTKVDVEPNAIYIKQDKLYTSAGVTAGMDMALAMVEEDWGKKVALAVAQELVLYLKRPGGQSQFSRQLSVQEAEDTKIAKLQEWMRENPAEDFSVPKLAERVSMSERNFTRRFCDQVGLTPGKFAEQLRIDVARRCLEDTDWPVDKLAKQCGFNNSETMRRTFMRNVGITPKEYRVRFQSAKQL